ncbi:protein-tyrosine phosphatase-like protein [Mycena crocata]|nr:protein-tyrosine phosphatase-like protein [Mycena crocata]
MSSPTRTSLSANAPSSREEITEILPNLFLGSQAGALDVELLRRKGITHILSVIQEDDGDKSKEGDGLRRMTISVQDWPDQELLIYFREANAFLDDARIIAQEGALVHCHQGVSRSATVVAAYLMATHPPIHDADSAINFLKARRPIVQPNFGFPDQLALYGRCGCNLEDNPIALEAWRAGRNLRWEGRVDRLKRERAEARQSVWSQGLQRMSRWAASMFP